jgi:hypothetical protein
MSEKFLVIDVVLGPSLRLAQELISGLDLGYSVNVTDTW